MRAKSPTGIRVRHSRNCPATTSPDARCKCSPSYEAFVFSVRDGKKLRKTFPSLTAAKAWRHDASTSVRKGTLRAATSITLREAADAWLAGARDGSIRTRSGDPYKPSVIRSYEQALRLRVLDDLGAARLGDVRRPDVQDFADRLLAAGSRPLDDPERAHAAAGDLPAGGRSAATSRSTRRPGLELPAVRGRRDRIASPEEAAALLDALPEDDRALGRRRSTRASGAAS